MTFSRLALAMLAGAVVLAFCFVLLLVWART
jgi:hypothetical protein